MKRRQFIGATAAVCVGAILPAAAKGKTLAMPVDLNWHSDVIETIAHNRAGRMPVVTGVSMKKDGSEIAIVGDDHCVAVYDMATQAFIHEIDAHRDWVRSAVYAPVGNRLATAGNDRTLRVWTTGNYKTPLYTRSHEAAIIELAYSPDATKLATVGFERILRVYDAKSGRVDRHMACPCPDNHAVAFSSDGEMIAAGGRCGTIRVWDVESGRKKHEMKSHRRRIRTLEFTSDGNLISAGDDQIVKVNNLASDLLSVALPRQGTKLFAVKTIAPSVIATSGSDNKIHIWNTQRSSEIGVLRQHTGTVTSLDYAQDVLVSGSFDTTVRIWTPDPDELAAAAPSVAPQFVNPVILPSASATRPASTKTNAWSTRR